MDKVRILVADDSALMRELYQRLLDTRDDFEVVGMAEDGEEAVEKALKLVPDVVILDVSMPKADGIKAAGYIVGNHPGIGIAVISAEDDLSFVSALMKDEPDRKAYILKSSLNNIPEFTRVINAVANGRTVLDSELAQKIVGIHMRKTTSPGEGLSEVGAAVLELIIQGFDDASITQTLGLNQDTMEGLVDSICGDLGLINNPGPGRGALAVRALINANGR